MLKLGGIAEAFRDANFRLYSVGSILSWPSYFVQSVAIAWVTWTLTHSTRWLAIMALLDAVPMALLAPLGGVLADRNDRFRLLMLCYGLATLHAAALTALASFNALTVGWLAALTLFHGVVHAFSVPAAYGLLPRFVAPERLAPAIAVSSAYNQLGYFVGPALAGFVLLHFGPAAAFASNVVGYGIYLACAAGMRAPAAPVPTPTGERTFWSDFLAGLAEIRAHPGIRGLLTLMLFTDAIGASVQQMLPALADRGLNAGLGGLSTLLVSGGVGAMLAALWVAQGGSDRLRSGLVLGASLLYLAATAALLGASALPLAAVAMAIGGAAFEICQTGTIGLLQTSTPDAVRGRVMSAQFFLQQVANALGYAVVGGLAGHFGLATPLLCACALALLVWAAVFRRREGMEAAFEGKP